MSYYKDTKPEEHKARCDAIMAHIDQAKKRDDRRLGDAAAYMARLLDDRRKVPWGSDVLSTLIWDMEEPKRQAFGDFVVAWCYYSSSGLSYQIEDSEGGTLIEIPIAVRFDVQATYTNILAAEKRACAIAMLLQDTDSGMMHTLNDKLEI